MEALQAKGIAVDRHSLKAIAKEIRCLKESGWTEQQAIDFISDRQALKAKT